MNYLNGYNYPRFALYNGSTFVKNIDLDLTMSKGLVETIEEHSIEHELLSYAKSKTILGYSFHFSLSYDEYTSKSNLTKIFELLNAEKSGYTIRLYPRSDVLSRYFTVIGMNKELTLGLNKGLDKATGHRLVELKYTTKYIQTWLYAYDPDTVTKVIFGYENQITI